VVAPPRSDAYEDGESGLVCRTSRGAKSPGQGKRRQPVRADVRRRGQPPGQGKRRPPARARAEELLNNYKPPAIPSQALTGAGFREALAFLLSFWASRCPDAPFSPCRLKGGGFRAISGIGTGHRYAWLRCHLFWARAPGATTRGPNNALAPATSAGADLPPAGAG
jgi:hypothetical protein